MSYCVTAMTAHLDELKKNFRPDTARVEKKQSKPAIWLHAVHEPCNLAS